MADESSEPKSSSDSSKSKLPDVEPNYGYDMFPERTKDRELNLTNWLFNLKSRDNIEQYKCEKKIVYAFKRNPLLRIMISALEKAGCPIDFRRHIQAEYCEEIVTGGYDPVQNQIVICYNTANSQGSVESVLFHELIHMFDNCTKEMDFKNIEHVACSEIRAANLTYCSFLSAFYNKDIPRSQMKKMQPECVKKRAVDSVYAVRPVSREEAVAAVERVFNKCYKDTEPIGRRIRRNSCTSDLAYSEAFLLGYD